MPIHPKEQRKNDMKSAAESHASSERASYNPAPKKWATPYKYKTPQIGAVKRRPNPHPIGK